ncbi:MAG TPA: flagellar basal-body MS-ring/collar protein FliF [Acidobacteriota bacterium]|nr:flagellar basal-body MS-ring/collar protein FliF [Acidobacteriota bacterium]
MPVNRPAFLSQLHELWARLEFSQRLTVIGFGTLVFGALATLVYFMNRVDYQVLYRDLNPEDAQAIAAKLRDEKRDYLVQGTSILVAGRQSDVDKLRLEIAGSGLAHSGKVGYEIFDKNPFGMTDFTEQVNLQRALEGELSRTIASLSEISHARVHIVLPKDSVFEEKKEEAKASVVVGLKRGAELSKSGIAGIKGVVAGAVPGLHGYNVSIVDEEGRLLSQSIGSADGGRAEIESGVREQLEKEMVSKVVSILEPVVGKGKVNANASIDIDFNSTEQTEETYNPNPQTVLSQQRTEERMGGVSSAASGVPGTQSNVGSAPVQSQTTNPERLRQSEVTNYEVSKTVRHTVQPKGTIRRLSVAVLLDHKTTYTKGQDGKVSISYFPRSKEELAAYRELVLAAVGYDEERGDTITLENVAFYNDNRPEEEKPPLPWYVTWQSYLIPAMKYAAFLVLFLLVYLTLFRPIRKRVLQTMPGALGTHAQAQTQLPEAPAAQLPSEAPPKALAEPAHPDEGQIPSLEPSPLLGQAEEAPVEEHISLDAIDDQIEREFMKEASMLDLGGRKYALKKKKLMDRAKKEPEMVSQLIRTWIQEKG